MKACSVQCTLKCMIEEGESIRTRGGGGRLSSPQLRVWFWFDGQKEASQSSEDGSCHRVSVSSFFGRPSALSSNPPSLPRMVPSALNGTICYCLISEKLLMPLRSRGKCVKGWRDADFRGIIRRFSMKPKTKKGRRM